MHPIYWDLSHNSICVYCKTNLAEYDMADCTSNRTENPKNLCITTFLYYCYNHYVAVTYKKIHCSQLLSYKHFSNKSQICNLSRRQWKSSVINRIFLKQYFQFPGINSHSDKGSYLHQFLHPPTGCPFKIPLFGWGSSSTIRESTPKKKTLVISEQVRLIPGPP